MFYDLHTMDCSKICNFLELVFRTITSENWSRFEIHQISSWHKLKKVKRSPYRTGLGKRVPGSYDSQISWQRHRMVVRMSSLGTVRVYPHEIDLILISVRGRVDPMAIVRPEGLCHWKIRIIPLGIEPETCRFV